MAGKIHKRPEEGKQDSDVKSLSPRNAPGSWFLTCRPAPRQRRPAQHDTYGARAGLRPRHRSHEPEHPNGAGPGVQSVLLCCPAVDWVAVAVAVVCCRCRRRARLLNRLSISFASSSFVFTDRTQPAPQIHLGQPIRANEHDRHGGADEFGRSLRCASSASGVSEQA